MPLLISRKNWIQKISKGSGLNKERTKLIAKLLSRLSVRVPSWQYGIVNQSLTHSSYAVESRKPVENNERLEFLGDSVLGLVVSDYLHQNCPHLFEGGMTRLKSSVVSRRVLARVAKEIQLGEALLMGKGEEQDGGREKSSLLADSLEALMGAVFVSLGYEKTRRAILFLMEKEIQHHLEGGKTEDYKSDLQQYFLSLYRILPHYEVVREEGPPHKKRFFVHVRHQGKILGEGSGFSKKEAEQKAAREAISVLQTAHPKARLTLPSKVV